MKLTTIAVLSSTLLVVAPVSAQGNKPDPFLQWMDRIAQEHLDRREKSITEIRTVADAEQRKKLVRAKLMEILGGLPDYQGPLRVRITGRIPHQSYAIEKVIFESLPGFYVTANLYRPNAPGRYPGILLQAGHTQEGKVEPQRLASNLALKGFVSLAFDPIGQGEREQTYNPEIGGALAGWSVNEHLHAGAQAILVGESVARYFVWDAKRALDYLVSRPEVDPARIGAMGCSGGGATTTFIAALDPRIKAVVPACFPTSYRLLFAGPDPDSEMGWPNFLASGLDTADFVELSAPTPWQLQATEEDYFTPPGVKITYEDARRWYKLYGAEDKIAFFVGPGPHGTPLASREAVYEWFIRWLKDGKGDPREQPVELHPNHELLVTRTGHVDDEPGSRKVYQLILDDFRAKRRQGTIPELLAELRRLQIPSDGAAPPVTVLEDSTAEHIRRQRIKFESEPGVQIEGKLCVPASPAGRKTAVLIVADKTSSYWIPSTSSIAERIAKAGRVVLELDPRDSPAGYDNRPFLGDWLSNSRANQIGLNLPAMRAHDILRGVDVLAAREDVDATSIRATARAVKGVWVLLAAAVDPRIGKIWLDRTPYSLRAALENTINTDIFDAVIPGFALRWDLEDLVKAMGDRTVLWTDPTNWMHRPVALDPPFRYRHSLGDDTDHHDDQDNAFIEELIR
jgi:cephalosporin-C deacetylase-like acetyl esterase